MDIAQSNGEYLKLARSKSGQLFRKQILRKGKLIAPNGDIIDMDDDYLQHILDNYESEVCDIVTFPLVDEGNQHSEDPDRNRGEVIGLERDGDALYAIIDVRANPEAVGNTILGASAMLHQDYLNTKTGERVGPTLLHVAATNRPHVTSLEPYEKLALSADTGDQISLLAEMSPSPTTEPAHMERDELAKLLKDEHQIDLDALLALQTKVGDADLDKLLTDAAKVPELETEKAEADKVLTALSALLTGVDPTLKLSADSKPDEVATQVATVVAGYTSLKSEVDTLKLSATTHEVDDLVKKGMILPAKRDAMLKLAASDHETFLSILPDKALIALSAELGTTGPKEADEVAAQEQQFADDVDRYTKMAAESGVKVKG